MHAIITFSNCMSTVNVIMHLTCIDKFMYMQACLTSSLINYMHACFARNYLEALSHCGHRHDLTSVAQLSVINIRSVFDKTLASERFHRTLSTAHRSRGARQRWASMLVNL